LRPTGTSRLLFRAPPRGKERQDKADPRRRDASGCLARSFLGAHRLLLGSQAISGLALRALPPRTPATCWPSGKAGVGDQTAPVDSTRAAAAPESRALPRIWSRAPRSRKGRPCGRGAAARTVIAGSGQQSGRGEPPLTPRSAQTRPAEPYPQALWVLPSQPVATMTLKLQRREELGARVQDG
jgi:hypothetical protein